MKTTHKQILALLLALVLLLSLCACVQKTQTEPNESRTSTDKVKMPTKPDKKTPEKQPEEAPLQNDMRDRTSRDEASDTQPVQYGFSQEAETSLGWLRDRIDFPMTMFGAAYLGYVGGLFEEGFETGFPAWLWETNEAMLLKYPFIAEIDEEHMIGGAGHLYCIVPVDENATVAINRVQWNEKHRPTRSRRCSIGQRAVSRCCSLQISTALHMRPTRRSLSPTTTGIPANGIPRLMR